MKLRCYIPLLNVIVILGISSLHIFALLPIIYQVNDTIVVGSFLDYIFRISGYGEPPYRIVFTSSALTSLTLLILAEYYRRVYGEEMLPKVFYLIIISFIVIDILTIVLL